MITVRHRPDDLETSPNKWHSRYSVRHRPDDLENQSLRKSVFIGFVIAQMI